MGFWSWRQLIVVDSTGASDTLENIVHSAPAQLDTATRRDGRIVEWPDFFLVGPVGTNWSTSQPEIDWNGFEQALAIICGWDYDEIKSV